MFDIDDRDVRRLERDLTKASKFSVPIAVQATLNNAAFKARAKAQDDIAQNMVLRNAWTKRSIQVQKAKGLSINRMGALMGSRAEYMAVQQFGGTKTGKGKHGVAITTGYAAGQEGARPRTRLGRKANRAGNIRIRLGRKPGKTKAQQNLIAVKEAAKSGTKYVYMDLGRRKGLFRVLGGKRKPRVKMVQDLTRKSVRIPRNPWMTRAVDQVVPMIPRMYGENLGFQVRRLPKLRVG